MRKIPPVPFFGLLPSFRTALAPSFGTVSKKVSGSLPSFGTASTRAFASAPQPPPRQEAANPNPQDGQHNNSLPGVRTPVDEDVSAWVKESAEKAGEVAKAVQNWWHNDLEPIGLGMFKQLFSTERKKKTLGPLWHAYHLFWACVPGALVLLVCSNIQGFEDTQRNASQADLQKLEFLLKMKEKEDEKKNRAKEEAALLAKQQEDARQQAQAAPAAAPSQ